MLSRRLLLGAGVSFALAAPAEARRPERLRAPTDITIRSFPINSFDPRDSARVQFGRLTFRGGLELQSDSGAFGGFSSLRLDASGRKMTAISDSGHWLSANLTMIDGKVTGLTDGRMAPILNQNGRPIADTADFDSEGLWIEGGVAYVSIERTHRILRFDTFGKDGFLARGTVMNIPYGARKLRANRSVEAIGLAPRNTALAGNLLAISEESLNENGDIRAFIMGPKGGEFAVKRTNDYAITDLTFLPDGDLLILERWFSAWRGVAMRIRRIDINDVKAGATVDGSILMSADMAYQIDNMEGLAIHREESGALILTLISDNNFSFFQRTVLLQFSYGG